MVKYIYDAWGKVLSTSGSLASTLGTVQPFRYRGYVYDVETGLYYLRSRYYNPYWQRFVNTDSLLKGNIFSYCYNKPISWNDKSGNIPQKLKNPNPKLLASDLIIGICSLEKDNVTKYSHGSSNREYSDCIGLILQFVYAAYKDKIYINSNSKYNRQVNIEGNLITIGTYVEGAVEFNAIDGKKGLIPIPKGNTTALDELLPGVLVVTKDFSHIGIYVGYYTDRNGKTYEHCVIDCTRKLQGGEYVKNGIYAGDISDSVFDYYCQFNYIEYDVDYIDSVLGINSFVVRD